MADPILDRGDLDPSLRLVVDEVTRFLAGLDEARVRPPGEPGAGLDGPLPDDPEPGGQVVPFSGEPRRTAHDE